MLSAISLRSGFEPSALAAVFCLSLANCAGGPSVESQSNPPQQVDVAQALQQYSEAWAKRDPEAILDLHAEETEFHLVTLGSHPAETRDEVREAFDAILTSNPNYKSSVRAIRFGNDFALVEYDVHMDAVRPARAGDTVFVPSGTPYWAPAVDIIVFDKGLVAQKITYLDTETIRANSKRVERASK